MPCFWGDSEVLLVDLERVLGLAVEEDILDEADSLETDYDNAPLLVHPPLEDPRRAMVR